ncbi:MAG: ABC transporter permease [Candidatus Electrothrix sp. AW1]|nr:ABC transporter permease [Candidatus Electrothrix sp. AX1]MCI5183599.1 ABC transporter permease [Candidatus Electrothrix gigas]
MISLISKKILSTLLVVLGATFCTYTLMHFAPGDPALEIAVSRYGGQYEVDQATVEWIRESEGLDKPLYLQYLYWLRHVLRLDLGRSLVEEAPVAELISQRFPKTLILAAAACCIALCISLPLGILAGLKQGSWVDSLSVSLSVAGVSMPNYWLGLVLILLFAVRLHWLPSFGTGTWQHIILPAITLGTALTAYTTRILRSAIIETMQAEHIMALQARGVNSRLVLTRHLFRNAMIPLVTVIGIEFGMILEGAVITETVFAWPGLGELMVSAVSNRDYPLIQGLVLFCVLVFVSINLLTDLTYRLLDPRIRL